MQLAALVYLLNISTISTVRKNIIMINKHIITAPAFDIYLMGILR